MPVSIGRPRVRRFTTTPRTGGDIDSFWRQFKSTVAWSDKYGYVGTLLFTGNDVFIEPWLLAQYLLAHSRELSPLVAINPIYMHPFTSAKFVSSLCFLYGRPIFLNMVTGTALSYQEALGDQLSHDARYLRLSEYMDIMKSLLSSREPTSVRGNYYQAINVQLYPFQSNCANLEFFLAGHSEAALSVIKKHRALGVQMLSPELERTVTGRGIHFGIVTRPTLSEAQDAARTLFPSDRECQEMLDYSMSNTDSVWKQTLRRRASDPEIQESGFWLGPFRNFKADCPYFVGNYERVAGLVWKLSAAGVDTFILDIPAMEEEYAHIDAVFHLASTLI